MMVVPAICLFINVAKQFFMFTKVFLLKNSLRFIKQCPDDTKHVNFPHYCFIDILGCQFFFRTKQAYRVNRHFEEFSRPTASRTWLRVSLVTKCCMHFNVKVSAAKLKHQFLKCCKTK